MQIRRDYSDNLGIVAIIFHNNNSCDPSLELSHWGSSNEGHNIRFDHEVRKK